MVGKIKRELISSIYAGVKAEDQKLPPGSKFHFSRKPYFFDNLKLERTIKNLQGELSKLDVRVARTDSQNAILREETEALEARIIGLKLRVHSAEQELAVFKETTQKKEAQLLSEMQLLRDKIIQGAFTSHGGGPEGQGGGLAADNELMEIMRREMDRTSDVELNNAQLKDALGFCSTLMMTAVQSAEENFQQYEAQGQYWEKLTKTRQNILLLHDRGTKTIEEMGARDLMIRWMKYHLKVSRQENPTGLFSDPGVAFTDMTQALDSGDVLIDVLSQVCPPDGKPASGEVLEAKSIGMQSVFDLVSRLAHSITDNDSWRSCELGTKHSVLQLEVVGACMLASPRLNQEVFGFAKQLQTRAYNLSEELEKLRQNHQEFMRKISEAKSKGAMVDVAAVEMTLASITKVKTGLSEGWVHLGQVQEELERTERIWMGVAKKVRAFVEDASIQKTRRAEANERRAYQQGKEDGLSQVSEFDDSVSMMAPIKAAQAIEVEPGGLAKHKPTLPPAAKSYLKNLTLDKLHDIAAADQHEKFVDSLEKCAEFTINSYDVLRKCFRHYCKIHQTGHNIVMGGASMSYAAWESLLSDIRVLGYDSSKKMTAKRCEDIFKLANMYVDGQTGRIVTGNKDLEAPEFIEGLIRISAEIGTKNALELPFSYLQVVKMISQYAKKERTETFRRACRDSTVQDLLHKNEESLKEIYNAYAKLDNTADDIMEEMNLQEFLLFARDANIIDSNLTQTCIVNIFIYVQDEDPDTHHVQDKVSEGADGGAEVETDRQLDFGEFCEALCGCSCYKILDPYFTLQQKVDHLCSRFIVPFATKVKRKQNRANVADSILQIAKAMG